jgi:predicted 3-demethylubiquinone-9 3-methyltransferase (glyoxalase superfamily)
MAQKIIPHLWFDREAYEAATFYTGIFHRSEISEVTTLKDTPSGDAETVRFELAGTSFAAISAGPYFQFNPSVSFMVLCPDKLRISELWRLLINGGGALMPLQAYPFSPWYGWLRDKYGVTWQLMLDETVKMEQIKMSFLFSGSACGMAEAAADRYTSLFSNSEKRFVNYYGAGEAEAPEAKANYIDFVLAGQPFVAMDNGYTVDFEFNEAISLMVLCEDQAEIDNYWHALSAVPEAEQCGWLKDRFGMSWQIVPVSMDKWMRQGTPEEIARITQCFLKMKKLDIAAIEAAAKGNDI